MRKRRRTVAAAAALALAGLLVWLLWPGPNLREGSVEVGDATLRITDAPPAAYRIVYRAENRAGGETIVTTESVLVRRPFEAHSLRRAGTPPGGRRQGRTVNAFGRLRNDDLVLAVPPAPASLDRRADAFFPDAARAGYAEPLEARRVAGRPCRIFRTAGVVGVTGLEPAERARDTYTDTCVDGEGFVLEEVTVVDGEITIRRLATHIEEDPDVPDAAFEVGDPTIPVRQGGGSVQQMRPTSRPPGTFWELREVPEGFEHRGRYAIVPPQTGFDDPTQRQGLVAFTSEVWVKGLDVLIVEQGATLGGSAPFAEDRNARRVRLGELGRGQVVYAYGSIEVRVLQEGGRFVRVLGTLEASELVAAARSLEEVEGGELEFIGGPGE